MCALQSCPICLEDFTSEPGAGGSRGSRIAGSSEAGPSSGKAAAADSLPLLGKLSGDKGGTAAKGSEQAMSRTPLALPCGHRFCTPCITRCDCLSSASAPLTLPVVTHCTAHSGDGDCRHQQVGGQRHDMPHLSETDIWRGRTRTAGSAPAITAGANLCCMCGIG